MFELAIASALAILTLVTGVNWPWLLLVTFLIVLPGLYATMRGAPFVPSSKDTVERMLRLAAIQPGDNVFDLGCGDGRLVIAAAASGAHATGYELSIPTYLLAKVRSLGKKNVRIAYKDFWKQDYREADVIFCFLLTSTMQTFKDVVWPTLKPGCRVVSHAFKMDNVAITARDGQAVVYVR